MLDLCNDYVDGDVKVRDHCHIAGKYRGSAHRDCNIKVKLNHTIPIVFCNLKNYDMMKLWVMPSHYLSAPAFKLGCNA